MSAAAMHASAVYEQVAKDGRVFTFLSDDSYLVFPVYGTEVVSFWSSRSRMEKIQSTHPHFSAYTIAEYSLSEFLEKTLFQLEEQSISVGVNWSGKRLTGYDVSVADLRRNIGHWLSREQGDG
ncbi:MAG TPA: DUF2750 domain-containing protein [Pirellulaceae bacterium]|nr:DUF2750 domain-containing protein [Pirellulaceae bacterium]